MYIVKEDDILDIEVRIKLIRDLNADTWRKAEAFRRYQCYKDKTYLYVIDDLLRQFDGQTVNEMRYALSNLGICRKIIDKLARVYKYGVDRELIVNGEEIDSDDLKQLTKLLYVDQTMRKTNRFFKLFRNTLLWIRPISVDQTPDSPLTIELCTLPPFHYDPVVTQAQPTKPLAYILSDYDASIATSTGYTGFAVQPGTDGRYGQTVPFTASGDFIPLNGPTHRQYKWWSANYHFVTDEHGVIVPSDADGTNPIGVLPFVNYCEDQDNQFWSEGGNDLADGSILINSMLTNINHIGITQGYGQLVMTGKDLPTVTKVGPNKAVRLIHDTDDPVPTFDFKSASPPLDELRAMIDMQMALLLTTNNLSTSGVASSLAGGKAFPSGIAMLIDKSESMEDVEDQRQIFQDNEPVMWDIIARWHRLLKSKGELTDDLNSVTLPDDFDVGTYFNDPKPIETEIDRLTALQLRDALGIISKVDMIKSENPELTDEQAQAKLEEIQEQNPAPVAPAFTPPTDGDGGGPGGAGGPPDTAIPGENAEVAAIQKPRTALVLSRPDDSPRKGG